MNWGRNTKSLLIKPIKSLFLLQKRIPQFNGNSCRVCSCHTMRYTINKRSMDAILTKLNHTVTISGTINQNHHQQLGSKCSFYAK